MVSQCDFGKYDGIEEELSYDSCKNCNDDNKKRFMIVIGDWVFFWWNIWVMKELLINKQIIRWLKRGLM